MQKIILVTGANRGIGKEIVFQLVAQKHQLIATARSLEKLKAAFPNRNQQLFLLEMDVADEQSVADAALKFGTLFNLLDVVINNAGIGVGETGLAEHKMEEVKEIMEVNFFGPMRVNKAFLPYLKASREGRIINLSSGMGAWEDLTGGNAGYRLSKAGLNAQTVLLSNELINHNIKVNAMCPGWVKTEMGGEGAPRSIDQGADTAVWLATKKEIPTGKFFRDRDQIPW